MLPAELYMLRCLELAALGAGRVSPNPMVGAVIVHNDRIIGEGFHQQYGGPHAEVRAIADVFERYPVEAPQLLKECTLYVSLEPCSHFGKTPPCSDLIVQHGIPNVVIGAHDPFPAVNGKGISQLQTAGIHVTVSILKQACEELNKRFFTGVQKQRPYIILKWAQTADGYFAPADRSRRWISSDAAKKLVHKWRSEEDAVLVGKNTALADDPSLTVREWSGRNPVRIVVDRRLDLPDTHQLFDNQATTIILNEIKTEYRENLKWIALEDFDHYLPQMIAFQLYLLDVRSLLIEGGAAMLQLFIDAGLWDEARVFTSATHWGEGITAPKLPVAAAETIPAGQDQLSLFFQLAAVEPVL